LKANFKFSIAHLTLHLSWSVLVLKMIDCAVLHLVSMVKNSFLIQPESAQTSEGFLYTN